MDLTFIHWAVAPEVVAPFMPPGVRPDVFDGLSYVALVPFSMQRIGLFGAPAWSAASLSTSRRPILT